MSVERRAAVVRTSLQAWAERDIDRMVEGWAPQVVWDMTPYRPPWPGPARYVGIAEVLAFLATWMATWRTQDLWLEELLDDGASMLVILGRRGEVLSTGTKVDRRWAQRWSFTAQDEALRIVNFSDPQEARVAFAGP